GLLRAEGIGPAGARAGLAQHRPAVPPVRLRHLARRATGRRGVPGRAGGDPGAQAGGDPSDPGVVRRAARGSRASAYVVRDERRRKKVMKIAAWAAAVVAIVGLGLAAHPAAAQQSGEEKEAASQPAEAKKNPFAGKPEAVQE